MRVSEYLESTPNPDQGFTQEKVAELLGVSPRTIYNWRKSAKQNQKKIGRPKHDQHAHRKALWCVGRELRRQGYPGWRTVKKGLKETVPDRLIQEYVSKFKLRRRRRIENKKKQDRKSIEVIRPNVIWSMDSAHFGSGKEAQIIKDRAARKLLVVRLGNYLCQTDVLHGLEAIKRERGLPLVLATDNGSIFVNDLITKYLEREKVIHLRSLPRTPEHNSSVEVAIRELKDLIGDDPNKLSEAQQRINGSRLRKTLGYQTADKFDEINSWEYNKVRGAFYRKCCVRIKETVQHAKDSREARMLEREAIHALLEEMGWIKRWRGDQSITT